MTLIEQHPYKMAFISIALVTLFAFAFHTLLIKPHDYAAVILWLPMYTIPFLIPATISHISKNK